MLFDQVAWTKLDLPLAAGAYDLRHRSRAYVATHPGDADKIPGTGLEVMSDLEDLRTDWARRTARDSELMRAISRPTFPRIASNRPGPCRCRGPDGQT